MTRSNEAARHWDAAYGRGEREVSWFQPVPAPSLKMIDAVGIGPAASVVDVGGGASRLVDELLDRGFSDLTVVDLSAAALDDARTRLAGRAHRAHWAVADVRTWRPGRRFDLWHDRATFHFLIEPADRDAYLATLDTATTSGSIAIFATFAPDGPERCSGLPVARYDADQIAAALGSDWQPIARDHEDHATPFGTTQSFTWAALRRR